MRVFNVQPAARPTLFDRNGITKAFAYFIQGVAPHTTTARWSYTVPAGKKFQIGTLETSIIRDAVATSAGSQQAQIYITPNGAASVLAFATINFGNVVNAGQIAASGAQDVLVAGDLINGSTSDISTGGSGCYTVVMSGTEGDA